MLQESGYNNLKMDNFKVTFHQTEGERLEEPLDVNDEEEDDKEDEEEDEDPTESMGIGANIVMAFVALGTYVNYSS